jgi:hypothetical protein
MNILRNIGGMMAGLVLWGELEHAASFIVGPGQILDLGEEFSLSKIAALGVISIISGCIARMIANGSLAIHLMAFILFTLLGVASIPIPFNRYSPRNLPFTYAVVTVVSIYLGARLWVFIERGFRRKDRI